MHPTLMLLLGSWNLEEEGFLLDPVEIGRCTVSIHFPRLFRYYCFLFLILLGTASGWSGLKTDSAVFKKMTLLSTNSWGPNLRLQNLLWTPLGSFTEANPSFPTVVQLSCTNERQEVISVWKNGCFVHLPASLLLQGNQKNPVSF